MSRLQSTYKSSATLMILPNEANKCCILKGNVHSIAGSLIRPLIIRAALLHFTIGPVLFTLGNHPF